MRSRRSRRSRRSLKLSHTQTSVPCGTLNQLVHVFLKKNNERISYFKIKMLKKKCGIYIKIQVCFPPIFFQLYHCLLWEAPLSLF